MARIERSFDELNFIDTLSVMNSPVHRIDPRAKLVTFSVFIVCVVSFGKHEVSALIPYVLFPAVIIPLAGIPARYLVKKMFFLLPFAVLIAAFNPLYDTRSLYSLGPLTVTSGMVSFASILTRFMLTVLGALTLIAVTGFNGICMALERFGVPKAFSVQLMMLYRYIFVLTSEASSMARARDMRSVGGKGMGMKVYGSLMGHLLMRTWYRAQRIHMAMLSRGFSGEFPLRRHMQMRPADMAFMLLWSSIFVGLRISNLPQVMGWHIIRALS